MTDPVLLLIAKQPLPGRVKTRLIGPVSAFGAAQLAEAALRDTVRALVMIAGSQGVILLDGTPGDWLPLGWRVIAQVPGRLDERLSAGFEAVGRGPAVLVGMDTPQLCANDLSVDLDSHDACLGLAEDGGYWAIGLADASRARSVIEGVPMSRADTGAIQLHRMRAAGMRVQQLPTLIDVDTPEAARRVATAHPHTHFAATWQALTAPALSS
jgi:glycosyltransferase A (GT-A) superfamily protein (DUF2064 family)